MHIGTHIVDESGELDVHARRRRVPSTPAEGCVRPPRSALAARCASTSGQTRSRKCSTPSMLAAQSIEPVNTTVGGCVSSTAAGSCQEKYSRSTPVGMDSTLPQPVGVAEEAGIAIRYRDDLLKPAQAQILRTSSIFCCCEDQSHRRSHAARLLGVAREDLGLDVVREAKRRTSDRRRAQHAGVHEVEHHQINVVVAGQLCHGSDACASCGRQPR